ncbi:MAG: vWA domain-containing protein [Dethiobacteria bacterium]
MGKKISSWFVVSIALMLLLGVGLQGIILAQEKDSCSKEENPVVPGVIDSPGENPDGLDNPREISAPALFYPASKTSLLAVVRYGMAPAQLYLTGHPGDHDNIEWPEPGSLQLSKTALPVEGTSNRWEVTLTLTGKNLTKRSDIVLVIDRSGSMDGERMTSAKNAARQFVNTLLDEGDPSTRIAVVSFSSDYMGARAVTVDCGFQDASGKEELLDAIDGLTALGGTFTQAGIRQARKLLDASSAENKNIVLLSDGEPTYSYRINNITSNLNSNYFVQSGNWWYTRDDLAESVFNHNGAAAGDGTSMITYIGSTGFFYPRYYYYHHGHSAIAESGYAKADSVTVYSVGLSAGVDGQKILERMASPGKSYKATAEDLEVIFQTIAGNIAYAATDALMTDPIGEMFSIPGVTVDNYTSLITVNQGTIIYNTETETIEWSIPYISQGFPATMTYIVELDDPGAESGELYPTNGETYVEYTNAYGQPSGKHFDIPEVSIVDGGTIVLTKAVENGGSAAKTFPIYVEGGGHTWSVLLAHGESTAITGLGLGTYTIRETVPMNYRLLSIEPATVTITVDDLNGVFEVMVTNRKVNDSWFEDDAQAINTFTVGVWAQD